ncbi:hypothetical protein H8D30_06335 [bacterium]|nr:hypothetical protein [bacterium]
MTDPLIPHIHSIESIQEEGGGVLTLFFSREGFSPITPGQGFKISVFGRGETTGVVSEVSKDCFGVSLQDVDSVTHRLFLLSEGQALGLRGPYGNGLPTEGWPEGKIGLFSMDMGLAAQRGLVNALLAQGKEVVITHLTTDKENPVLAKALEKASEESSPIQVHLIASKDRGNQPWETFLRDQIMKKKILQGMVGAAVGGTRPFQKVLMGILEKSRLRDKDIYFLVNRNWTTGLGWSNQDLLAGVNIWTRGPVFDLATLRDLSEDALGLND